jgi:cytochrome c oxidase subunit 2
MKIPAWLIGVASISLVLALGVLYHLREVWLAQAEVEALSQVKYTRPQPAAELPIEIVGQRFEWRIRYPSSRRIESDRELIENFAKESSASQAQADDVYLVNELHMWKRGPVQIYLKSADVPHSFFLPVMRLKKDVIPGQVIDVWLKANDSNVSWDAEVADWKHDEEWQFACVEHSGQGPTKMRGQLFVYETKADFLKWLKRAEKERLKPRSRTARRDRLRAGLTHPPSRLVWNGNAASGQNTLARHALRHGGRSCQGQLPGP